MKKRILSTLLALCMVLTLLPGAALAEGNIESGSCGENVTWTLDENGILTISGTGPMYDYGANFAGGSSMNPNPWYHNPSITKIVIESGVTTIGAMAFSLFYTFEPLPMTLIIPNSVKSIGESAFSGRNLVGDLVIPESVEEIGRWAFSGNDCTHLTLSEGIKSIGWMAFGSGDMAEVTLPISLESLGGWAFIGCENLQKVTVLSKDVLFEGCCFGDCPNIEKVTLSEGTHFEDGARSQFEGNEKLKSAGPIGSGCDIEFGWTTEIPNYAFNGWENLATIIIPNTVTAIGEGVLGSWKVTDVYFDGYKSQWDSLHVSSIGNATLHLRTCTHSWGAWEIILEPTETSAGKQERVCSICKEVESQTIPALEPAPSDPVKDKLNEILDKADATAGEIRDILESISKGDIKDAIDKIGDGIFDRIEALEERIGGSAEIEVAANMDMVRTDIKVVGAKLNFDYSKEVKLQVGLPEDDGIQVPNPGAEIFRFSLKLLEGAHNNIAELSVPVKITMPVPSLTMRPKNFTLWHRHNGELVPVTLSQEPYRGADGKWYVSFKVDGFSDFIMTYDEETTVQPPVYAPSFPLTRSLTLPAVSGGTVTAVPRFPSAGEWVTLTVTPDADYELTSLTVTNRYGQDVPITDLGNGRYGFTMPNADVTVNPVFTSTVSNPISSLLPGAGTGSTGYMDIIYPGPAMSFTDVQPYDWFYDSVNYVYTRRLMNGVSDTAFDPQGTTNRAMIWTVLARLSGKDTTGGESWYERGCIWAMGRGITDGTAPEGDITREQLVTMLWRFKGSPYDSGALTQFTDSASVSPYAASAVTWAVSGGLIKGDNGALNPGGTATRAEVAAILQRFCQTYA